MELLKSKTEQWVPCVNGIWLHSRYDPSKEGETFGRELGVLHTVVVVGLGFAYHLASLQNRVKKLFVLEPNQAVYQAYLKHFPAPAFQVLGGTTEKILQELRQSLGIRDLQGIKVLLHQPSVKASPELFGGLIEALNAMLEKSLLNLITDSAFGGLWTYNVLKNLRLPLRAPLFENKSASPVFLVGSGYTAKLAIPFLRQNQDKVILLAIPPVLPLLAREGITPDAVFLVDAGWANRHYAGSDFAVPLLTYLSSSSFFVSQWPGEVFFLSSSLELENFLIPEFPRLGMSGSVANSLLALAVLISDEIYMAGFDFAFVEGYYHYPGNSLEKALLFQSSKLKSLESRHLQLIQQGKKVSLRGGRGQQLVSNQAMSAYHADFCGKITASTKKKFYLLNNEGAFLPQTTLWEGNLEAKPRKVWSIKSLYPASNLISRLERLKRQFANEREELPDTVKIHKTRWIIKQEDWESEQERVILKIEKLIKALGAKQIPR